MNSPYVVRFAEDEACPREARRADVCERRLTDGASQASHVPVDVDGVEKVAVENVGTAAGALFHSHL